MKLQNELDPHRLGMTVMVSMNRYDLQRADTAILHAAAMKVADGIAEAILRKHKSRLVRSVMANPALLQQCKIAALAEAEKLLHKE